MDEISVVLTAGGEKIPLGAGDYYIAGYSNNVNKGTAKLTIKGCGNYGGAKTVNLTIVPRMP